MNSNIPLNEPKRYVISKKSECNIIGTIGLFIIGIGHLLGNYYISGIGSGVALTVLHFRADYL